MRFTIMMWCGAVLVLSLLLLGYTTFPDGLNGDHLADAAAGTAAWFMATRWRRAVLLLAAPVLLAALLLRCYGSLQQMAERSNRKR